MANVIHSTLTYNANLSAAQAQIKALTSQVGVLSAAFNTLDKSAMKAQATLASGFMSSVGQIGGFTTQMVKTNSAVETFGQSITKNRLTMRQYFREAFIGYRKQQSMLNQLAKQQVMMQQSTMVPLGGGRSAVITPTTLDTIANKSAIAAQKMSIFNELVQGGSTRLLNFGKNTQWTGRQLMVGFTLPLVLFTALVSKQFREIDKELTRFEKVYGADLGESIEGSTKKMREQVKQLAFDISASYGIAAKETAALAADIAQTGKEGQALIDSIKQTTRLAVLGEVERQEAMRATLSIQNAFKLNTLELAESIDFLNAVENETSTNLQDLAGAIPRVGPVIQSLNGDIKDMSLLLVAMREGGVSAGEAANALKSGLGRLINPTKAARDVAASFGISLENIIQNSRGELIPMIFALQDSLQGLDDFAKAQVIEKLFGKYQFARMSALFENLRRQGSQTLSVMELASSSSTELASIANQELATLQQSSAMRFQRAVETMKNSLIPLGEILTETMIPILSGIGNAISSFMNFFESLPSAIKGFTKILILGTALAGPVVMLVGLFANLAANGIKAAMGLTKLGARLMGMKIDKFELLTKDVMAATLGVDNLTTSFVEQDIALKKLSQTLGIYGARLQQTLLQNPSFIAGRAGPLPLPVARRQAGSQRPEFVPGQGRGDRIPAMLEPGEFVVNRKATEQFAPILMAMNRGTVQGFQEGTHLSHISRPRQIAAGELANVPGVTPTTQAALRSLDPNRLVLVYNNLVVAFQKATNAALANAQADTKQVITQLRSTEAWSYIMKATGLSFDQLKPVIASVTGTLEKLNLSVIGDDVVYDVVEKSLRTLGAQGDKAAQALQVLASQFNRYQGGRHRGGLGIAPDYHTPITGTGRRVQDKPFTSITHLGGPAPVLKPTPGWTGMGPMIPTPAAYQGVAKAAEQELGLAQRRVAAAKTLETYQTHRQKLLDKLAISERQEALLRQDIARITKDSTIPLHEKLRLQNEINADIKQEGVIRERISGALIRLEGNIQAAANRVAYLGGPTGMGYGPTSKGYLFGGTSPYAKGGYATAVPLTGNAAVFARMDQIKTGPSSKLSDRPATAVRPPGPQKDGMQMAGMRGQGAMNAAFMSTMLISSFSMMGGASNDLAIKLGLLSTAVMTATIAMQMFAGKNVKGNFLGLSGLGARMQAAGQGPTSSLATRTATKGDALFRTGAAVSMLGGPLGMAAAAAAVAGVTGFMLYKKAAEEARERAVAAFADPAKTAEYFGVSVSDVTDKLKAISSAVPGLEEVDENLRVAVREDYAKLIEKIRYGGAEAGGKELGIVFNKMIASGLSAEQAKEAVKAIAIESGTVGGQAYAQAMRQGMLADKSGADIARSMAATFDPEQQADSIRAAQATLDKAEDSVGRLGRIGTVLSQASDNIIGDIASYGIAIGAGIAGVDFDREGFRETITLAAETERQIHQMQVGIEEMSDVSADSIVKITEVMFENFKKAPQETIDAMRQIQEAGRASSAVAFDTQPIKDFISEIDPIGGIILNSIIGDNEEIAGKVMEGIAAGMSITEIIDALEKGGIPELDIQVNLNIKEQNVQLELDRLKSDLQEDLVLDLDMQIEDEEEQLDGVNKQLERMDKFRARHEGVLKKEMNRLNRASQTAIDGMEGEIDLIRERADARREDFDERMDELNKEKDQIDESADAYIDSLRKRERADSFYSNQRKTAFGALQKLAAGDVFGFLQDREQMSSEAQTFAYDNAIESIEDKRDREIDAIDEVMDKEKEKQEDYEKKVEKRIELIQDQIDAEKDLMDQRQKDFDRQMRFFDRREKRRKEDLESEKRELEVSLTQLRATRDMAEKNVLIDQERLSKALGEEKAKPYMVEQKEILKTEMMKKYLEMKSEFPDESPLEWRQRAYTDLMDLFNAVYGITNRPGQSSGTSMMNFQLQDIGFTPNFNAGGPVKGPGTPTSDSIPAMLSNGEYVVRASSVSKYGKSMMDTINAGKFAAGGYISADRAETAASGNKYLGGVKPKPAYSGGTPTSSTGYSTANTQATKTSGYKKKIWDQPKGRKKTSSGGILGDLFAQGMRQDFSDFISGMAPEEYRNLIGMNLSGDRNYGQRAGWEKALGSGLFATMFLPSLGLGLKAATSLGRYLPKIAAAYKGSRFASDRGSLAWSPGGVGGSMVMRQGLAMNKIGPTHWMSEDAESIRFKVTDAFNEDDLLVPGAELHVVKPYGYGPSPGNYPTATWMASHPDFSGQVPLMLALAARAIKKKYGVPITADSSLSERAYSIVEKFVNSGYVQFNPSGTTINPVRPDIAGLGKEFALETPRGTGGSAVTSQPSKEWLEETRQFLRQVAKQEREKRKAAEDAAWAKVNAARGLAKGGLVGNIQKFAEGGEVRSTARSGQPHSRSSEYYYSQNGWPYISNYGVAPLQSGKIPGSSVSLSMHRDVLPLFLAIASEYNKKIRKIDGSQSAGFGFRNNQTNHRSGTAMDLNWSDEGAQSDSQALHDWWRGKKSPAAPWSSLSGNPARTAVQIRDHFNKFGKIIEWYGSSKVGGDLIAGQGITSDWMHWQIDQNTKPGPAKIKDVIKKLGIGPDGTVEGGSGEEPSDNKGGKGSGGRGKNGSNGTGAGGRYMPASGVGGRLDPMGGGFIGKALPRFLSAIQLPGSDTSSKPKPGGGKDKPGDTPSGGNYNNQYIKGSQLVKLLHQTGFKGADLRTAYGVVMGESGGNRKAVNNNGTNKDWGLFQMNDYWNRNIVVDGKKADFTPAKIFDAQYNSRFALATTKDPGVIAHWKDPWKDWNAYSNNTPWYQRGLREFDANPQWRKALNLNSGGMIRGSGGPVSDNIPAMLSNGEYVIRADSVRKYGKDFLDKVNSGQLGMSSYSTPMPEMAMCAGGMVGMSVGGMVSAPSFNMPNMNDMSSTQVRGAVSSSSSSSTSNNSNNVKIVINGAGKNANAIANKVAKMINSANKARNHSRSTS